MANEKDTYEYRLTGRFWVLVVGVALCGAAIIFFEFFPTTSWTGIFGWWRVSNLTLSEHDEIIQYACGAAALLMVAWSLASPWITRRLLITSENLTIFESKLSGSPSSVIPLLEIRQVSRSVRSAVARHDNALMRSLRETVRFSYDGSSFGFSNAQFRSNAEFEDFCMRIGAPKRSMSG